MKPPYSETDTQNLREHRDALQERLEQMEVQNQRGDIDRSDLEAQFREMREQMNMLTREMGRFLVPPSYASDHDVDEIRRPDD